MGVGEEAGLDVAAEGWFLIPVFADFADGQSGAEGFVGKVAVVSKLGGIITKGILGLLSGSGSKFPFGFGGECIFPSGGNLHVQFC